MNENKQDKDQIKKARRIRLSKIAKIKNLNLGMNFIKIKIINL